MKRTLLLTLLALILTLSSVIIVAQGGLNLPEDLNGYWTWQRANQQKSFEETMHPVAKDIYYNEVADITLATGAFPHSEGSMFVKETTDPGTLEVKVITAMRKVVGFNPSGGDWQCGMFERADDGTFMGGWMEVEGASMCMGCHIGAQATDYTFLTYLKK